MKFKISNRIILGQCRLVKKNILNYFLHPTLPLTLKGGIWRVVPFREGKGERKQICLFKRHCALGTLICVVLLLLSSCGKVDYTEGGSLEERIEDLVLPDVSFGSPVGIAIGIIIDGEKSIYTFGDTGLGDGPPKENTIFKIASITKTFTAYILSSMISDSLISLSDPINVYLPESVTPPTYNGEQIMIRHLVTHTSGLPRSTKNAGITGAGNPDFSNQDIYDFLNYISSEGDLPYLGTRYKYSNAGFVILGHILELASGQTYEQLLEERICSQLNMNDTKPFANLSDEQKQRMTQSFDMNIKPLTTISFGRYLGSGSLLSTTEDMLNYLEANIDEASPLYETMNECHNMFFVTSRDSDSDYEGIGLAWGISAKNEDITISHTGAYQDRSMIKFNKEKQIGIIVLANTQFDGIFEIGNIIFEWLEDY